MTRRIGLYCCGVGCSCRHSLSLSAYIKLLYCHLFSIMFVRLLLVIHSHIHPHIHPHVHPRTHSHIQKQSFSNIVFYSQWSELPHAPPPYILARIVRVWGSSDHFIWTFLYGSFYMNHFIWIILCGLFYGGEMTVNVRNIKP